VTVEEVDKARELTGRNRNAELPLKSPNLSKHIEGMFFAFGQKRPSGAALYQLEGNDPSGAPLTVDLSDVLKFFSS
jgi:hypothetical protein